MLAPHSPNKQNCSPSPHRPHKHPDHILEGSPVASKRLRARLADYQFEIKKLEEDFAEFRLLSGIEKEKAVRRLKEELEGEKAKNGEESRRWERRFAERQELWDAEMERYRAEIERKYRGEKEQAIGELQKSHREEVERLITANNRLTERNAKDISELKTNHSLQLQQLKEQHQSQVKTLTADFEAKIRQCQQAHEHELSIKDEEKKEVERAVEEVRKVNDKNAERFLRTIGTLQRQKHVLWEKKEDLEMKAKVLNHRYQEKTKETEEIRLNLVQEAAKVEEQRSRVDEVVEERFEKERLKILKQEYNKTHSFQERIQQLQSQKQTIREQYQQMFLTLQHRHDSRQPRKQDVVLIRDYKNQLQDQQRQMLYMHEQLKAVQMEKDNNEKNYNRIFTHQPRTRKSLSHRPDRETGQWLQGQTYDLRALLKINKK